MVIMSNEGESNESHSKNVEVEATPVSQSNEAKTPIDDEDTPNKRRHTIRAKNMKSAKFGNKSTSSPKRSSFFGKLSRKNLVKNEQINRNSKDETNILENTNDKSSDNDSLSINNAAMDSDPLSNSTNNVVSQATSINRSAKKSNTKKEAKIKADEKTTKKKNAKVSVKSHVLTDYYPVRRSSRKTKSLLQKEYDEHMIKAIHSKCEDGLSVVEFKLKGRGVVAQKSFKKGNFVVEYSGDLVDWTEAKRREQEYAKDPSIGCYMYYFVFDNTNYCVDATVESGRLGRLLNHSRKNPNCKTKLIKMPSAEKKPSGPRLVIVAKRDIKIGEELTYDYGDKDKETLQSHPWLKST